MSTSLRNGAAGGLNSYGFKKAADDNSREADFENNYVKVHNLTNQPG